MGRTGHKGRKDGNQAAIVAALRAIGVRVRVLNEGYGLPDLLCYSARDGYRLLETKMRRGQLTPGQVAFLELMPYNIVRSVDAALALYGVRLQ